MNIGETLRNLRKQADATQEDLAQYLGCSPQAVSRWERGEGYPEITLIPAIASFFKVTTDVLFGEEEEKRKARQQDMFTRRNDLLAEISALRSYGEDYSHLVNEIANMLNTALLEYPDDHRFHYDITVGLQNKAYNTAAGQSRPFRRDVIKIWERIAERATSLYLRNSVRKELCRIYAEDGEVERALALADGVSGGITSMSIRLKLLTGKPRLDQAHEMLNVILHELVRTVSAITTSDDIYNADELLTARQRVDAIRRCGEIIALGFSGDRYVAAYLMYRHRLRAFQLAFESGDYDLAMDCFEEYARGSITLDDAPLSGADDGVLMYGREFKYNQRLYNLLPNGVQITNRENALNILRGEKYAVLLKHPRYAEIAALLEPK